MLFRPSIRLSLTFINYETICVLFDLYCEHLICHGASIAKCSLIICKVYLHILTFTIQLFHWINFVALIISIIFNSLILRRKLFKHEIFKKISIYGYAVGKPKIHDEIVKIESDQGSTNSDWWISIAPNHTNLFCNICGRWHFILGFWLILELSLEV